MSNGTAYDIDQRDTAGPFDIIGDVHGCFEELTELLAKLGYDITRDSFKNTNVFTVTHFQNRKVIFLGDLVDRGPDSPLVLKLVMGMVSIRIAYCLPGNHDAKLLRYLKGKVKALTHGLALTVEQLRHEDDEFIKEVQNFLNHLPSHYIFDDGNLVVAHAGLKEEMHGNDSGAIKSFSLFGATNGRVDEYGFPVRLNWAADYRGKASVVYGHTPVLNAVWLNNTINIDTGCVFGGKLTALRYPEKELVSIDAKQIYTLRVKPLI